MADQALLVTIVSGGGSGITALQRLNANLTSPPASLLNNIGALLTASMQQAFERQALGEHSWKPRYPKQNEPKPDITETETSEVNIAGAVEDLRTGPRVKAHRFQDRPVLTDTGTLEARITFGLVDPFTVEAGSHLPYAKIQNAGWEKAGGPSIQKIDSTVKTNLAKFLKKKANKKYRERLGFLFQRETLETKVGARPFVGITPECADDIRRTIEEDIPK